MPKIETFPIIIYKTIFTLNYFEDALASGHPQNSRNPQSIVVTINEEIKNKFLCIYP